MAEPEWEKVKTVFYTALSQPAGARIDFVARECAGNDSLRSQVEELLESYESGFLEDSILSDPPGETRPTAPSLSPGYKFSHYEIVKLIGRGGMGEVYLADDTTLDRLTAIKILHDDSGLGEQAGARLLREARAAAKLDHPNIASVYEVGEADGRPFIAMQYVVGETLQFLIAQNAVSLDDAICYARQIAAALAEAHSVGLVHRDIKPANVIVDPKKQLKVLDFGLVKETAVRGADNDLEGAGLVAGTLSYMSPEHLRANEVDAQTDVWSLGVVLYQMISGRLPFRGESKAELIDKIVHGDIEKINLQPPDLSRSIDQILARALEKDRSKRYPTIIEFEKDLIELASPGSNVLDASVRRLDRIPAKKSKVWSFALPVVLLITLALGAMAVWQNYGRRSAQPFLDRSNDLNISSIFDVKRQTGGAITDLSFSPDGSALVFTLSEKSTSAIYVLPLQSREPSRLTSGTDVDHSPVWSPAGDQIAYLSKQEGKTAIWSVSPKGGEKRMLAPLAAADDYAKMRKWGSDGTKIFFEDSKGPKMIDLPSGIVSPVDLGDISGQATRGFSLSRDESKMLVGSLENGSERLWLKASGESNAKLISEALPRKGIPEWFPDNDSFVYSADEGGAFRLYVRDLEGTTRQITFSNFSASGPVVSPDGGQIAFVSNIDQANVFQTDIASGKHVMLRQGVNLLLFPIASPDGQHLAYESINESTRFMTGELRIGRLADVESSPPTLTGCCLQWSRDSAMVAYVRSVGSGFHLFTAGPDGSNERQITTDSISFPSFTIAPFYLHSSVFDWSPDSSKIAFVSRRSGKDSIWTVGEDGSDAAKTADANDVSSKLASPKWSPDSTSIAFVEADTRGSIAAAKKSRIRIAKNGRSESIAEFEGHAVLLDWSRSGDGVFVATAAKDRYRVLFVPVEPIEKYRPISELRNARPFGITMSPDGRWISYNVLRDGVDNICVTSLSEGQEKCITSNDDATLFFSGAVWTPDSRSLLYSKQTGGMQISLISLNNRGGEQ